MFEDAGIVGVLCRREVVVPATLLLLVLCIVATIVYNIFFHPLSSYPGPKFNAVSRLPYLIGLLKGQTVRDTIQLHEQYGDVVRIAPDELSYITSAAWRDIYGSRPGQPQNPKDPHFYAKPISSHASIIFSGDADHARFRRSLSHAFSESALRDQESLIKHYVDLLISQIHKKIDEGETTLDLVAWYNFTTFDIIGDLTFGEPFGCLSMSGYHKWVAMIFTQAKMFVYSNIASRLPGGSKLLQFIVPRKAKQERVAHINLTREMVKKRVGSTENRSDFFNHILKQKESSRQMTPSEMVSNANSLIVAGSETTATMLSGLTYHLLREPRVMEKLVTEIRESFASEDEISMLSVTKLVYMPAVINEAFRLYPPVPSGMPRIIQGEGSMVDGRWVPGKTAVSVCQMAAYHSHRNFSQPERFVPERFLGDPAFASDDKAVLQPFSLGPRACLGRNLAYAEIRLILARMIWNFNFELDKSSANWAQQKVFFLWDKGPLNVKVRRVQSLGMGVASK